MNSGISGLGHHCNDLRPDQNVPNYRKLNELVKLSLYYLAGVFHAP